VTSVGENEEKVNTIQPPFLCFFHLQRSHKSHSDGKNTREIRKGKKEKRGKKE